MRRLVIPLTLFLAGMGRADAFEPFRVQDIRVDGLQRVPTGTVFNYLPLRIGDTVDPERAAEAIRALYRTGFFQDVALSRDGDTLVVEVAERPSIATIDVNGNELIQTEDLLNSMKQIGLEVGQTFNRFLLNDVERELRELYQSRGQYDTRVTSTVSPLERNRVGIRIDIRESEPARIRDIRFVGNQRFSESELKDEIELGPKRWYQLLSDRDQYARERLAADLESLTSFYQNQGYINFTITSTQVTLTPERDGIFITVNLSEGDQFRIGEIKLLGDLIVEEDELRQLFVTKSGDIYSREQVNRTVAAIRERLGVEGYAFANVNAIPEINAEDGTVGLTYYVDPGKRVFVRRINIHGNYRTRDEVVRRDLRQMEGAWLSTEAIKRSQLRLQRTGFFEEVNIETPLVPGTDDQVDVNVGLRERLSGSFQIGAGYGDAQGVMFNISVEQDNVFGSGDRLAFSFNNSSVNRIYSIRYTDRYFTDSGITQTLFASLRETDYDDADLSDYSTDMMSFGAGYSIPIAEDDAFTFGFSYEDLTLKPGRETPQRILRFIDEEGDQFKSLRANIGWVRDTRNHAFFPTQGRRQVAALEATVPGSDLQFFKASYSFKQYLPLWEKTALSFEASVAHGDSYGGDIDGLPFFERYYAGGISTVRGYRNNSLGPKGNPNDPFDDDAIGGNTRILGSVEMIFPLPFSDLDSVRMSTFVDFGNVFTDINDIEAKELRASAGLGFVWLSPMGAFTISLAQPLNEKSGDKTQTFQFTIGTGF